MCSSARPAPTRPSHRLFRLASSLASASMIAACAPTVVSVAGDPPRLTVPSDAAEACALTTLEGEALADLSVAYRMRGVDVRECDGRRRLAVAAMIEEHRLEDAWKAEREARLRPWWKKLTPWRED